MERKLCNIEERTHLEETIVLSLFINNDLSKGHMVNRNKEHENSYRVISTCF